MAGPSGRSPAEIVGSNPTGGMDVCLLWVLYFQVEVSVTSYHSPRSVLPIVVRRCVWSRNLMNEEAMTRVGPQSPPKKCIATATSPQTLS
jgi:hypothetical protein